MRLRRESNAHGLLAARDRAPFVKAIRDDHTAPLGERGAVRWLLGDRFGARIDHLVADRRIFRPERNQTPAQRFGAQCVVASIDARRTGDAWVVVTHGGRRTTSLDALEWAAACERLGAGEILLTSIDRDGQRSGYDLELTRAVTRAVGIPVIASGGAGGAGDIVDALTTGGADAALVAGILHDGVTTVAALKGAVQTAGIPVRIAA